MGPVNFKIQEIGSEKQDIVHANRLKICKQRNILVYNKELDEQIISDEETNESNSAEDVDNI